MTTEPFFHRRLYSLSHNEVNWTTSLCTEHCSLALWKFPFPHFCAWVTFPLLPLFSIYRSCGWKSRHHHLIHFLPVSHLPTHYPLRPEPSLTQNSPSLRTQTQTWLSELIFLPCQFCPSCHAVITRLFSFVPFISPLLALIAHLS